MTEQASSAPAVSNPWLVAIAVMLATFMEVLDTSIAAVALPYIAGSLSATNDEATWVLTSYLVANAIVLPASTWFSLRFGRKRFLIACIVIFTVSSFACGAATSLAVILIARAIQGAGGGALQPLSQSILLESFPPQKRGIAMAVFALGVGGRARHRADAGRGSLTDSYSWRWAFYINIPVGVFAVFMISRYVEDPDYVREAKPGKLDGIGTRTPCHLAGLPADHSRQGAGRRLVQRDLDPLGGSGPGYLLLVGFDSRISPQKSTCGFACLPPSELHPWLYLDRPVRSGHLRTCDAAAAVLPGTHGVYGPGRRMGR